PRASTTRRWRWRWGPGSGASCSPTSRRGWCWERSWPPWARSASWCRSCAAAEGDAVDPLAQRVLRSSFPVMRPSLSIFFPAYNDAGTIASLALIAHMTARQLTDDYEVIVIDDGSPDHTGELLDEMALHFPWLKIVHHVANRGYGGALRTGFQTASKELVFYTDGDAQYDPRELPLLVDALTRALGFVYGIHSE